MIVYCLKKDGELWTGWVRPKKKFLEYDKKLSGDVLKGTEIVKCELKEIKAG